MEQVLGDKKGCSGCGACAERCPEKAITMQADAFGFLYPEIDRQRCIDCGLCRKICPGAQAVSGNGPQKVVALRSKDPQIIQTSQSGGAFAELAKCVLAEGGAVYGAAKGEDGKVFHIRVDRAENLRKLQGSKYVQSRALGIFRQAEQDLKAGKTVLFSGTPCQIAGLATFLGRDYANLYTIDLVCHGVMPPKLWEDYLQYARKRFGSFTQVRFRDKRKNGWRDHWESFQIGGKTRFSNIYRKLFYLDVFLRDCCYAPEKEQVICRYAGKNRVSDLTIGDFYGIEDTRSAIKDDNTGISLCLMNSEKGKTLFEKIQHKIYWEEHSFPEASRKNPHLAGEGKPFRKERIEKIRREYLEKGFRYIAGRYAEAGFLGIFKKLKRLPQWWRTKWT